MKICIVVGTRPEIVKMGPLMRECEQRMVDYFIIHSGQHYSYEMDGIFSEELKLPQPKYKLNVGLALHGNQTGNIMIRIEPILELEKPDLVLVQGDTNTVLATALTATKLGIKLGHVEAGLRSFDRKMPEETNRIVTDHISDYLFAPTEKTKELLLREGIENEKIFVVGNSIVDAVNHNINIAEQKSTILDGLGIKSKDYFLITIHRTSNVDEKEKLEKIMVLINKIVGAYKCPLVWPIHPRTKKAIVKFGLKFSDKVIVLPPIGYLDFLQLEKNAKLIFTDSGGVQEESCILKIPCITLRENTERPETIDEGANILAGKDFDNILDHCEIMLNKKTEWSNPFGDGTTAKKIIDIIQHSL